MEEKTSRWIILWFFLALFSVSAIMLGWLLLPFISKPSTASLLTCAIIFFILFIPTLFFVGILSKEAYDLYLMGKDAVISDQIKTLIENNRVLEKANQVLASINVEITGDELNKALSELGKVVGLFLYKQASAVASNVFKFLVYFFFMLLIIYYLLIDGKRLILFIQDLSPLPDDQDEKLFKKFKDMAGAILIGNGFCGLIQGCLRFFRSSALVSC